MDYDFEWFKERIYELTTINLNKYKEQQMKRRINTYVYRRLKLDFKQFYEIIANDKHQLDNFVEYLTINVSEFFRNPEQWELLRSELMPELLRNKGRVRIWSSACSSGEEPYSLAMIMDELVPNGNYEIIASDIDKNILERANNAIYRLPSIDAIPKQYQKWFTYVGDERYYIDEKIKSKVQFKRLDLLQDTYPSDVDLVVCRNVLIYLVEEAKDEIYAKFSHCMTKDGLLFVGSSEQIVNCKNFDLMPIKTYFYKKNS